MIHFMPSLFAPAQRQKQLFEIEGNKAFQFEKDMA